MSYLVNKIIREVLYKGQKTININEFEERKYIDRVRTVEVEGIKLKIKITAEDYFKIYRKVQENEKDKFIEESDSIGWLERCIVGNIKKIELDQERQNETNSLDMMSNTNFIYHPESLIEMQILCSMFIYFFSNKHLFGSDDELSFSDFFKEGSSNFIMLALFVEHIFSYVCAYYRDYDINKNGQIDINGIMRAPNESRLGNI